MSGGGHMALLAKRMKENEARRRALRQNKRHHASQIKDSNLDVNEFDFVKLSDKELEKVKEKHIKKIKKERRKQWIKTVLISLVVVLILLILIFTL